MTREVSEPTSAYVVEVRASGGVSVEDIQKAMVVRVAAMSRFSERAARLAQHFGTGRHVLETQQAWEDLPNGIRKDITEALA